MPINYLDNVNVTGTLSAQSNILTTGSFISGGTDLGSLFNAVNIFSLGGGTANIQTRFGGNSAIGGYSSITGGVQNSINGLGSSIAGGYNNTASGNYSFIAGGSGNNTSGFSNAFILGASLSASQPNYTYVNNLSSQNKISTVVLSTSSLFVGSVSSTTVAVGALTAKMPIYNASGTFIGYIPIYTS